MHHFSCLFGEENGRHHARRIRNLGNIDSEILIEEFTMFFMVISNVTLNDQ
jgi:hypothetical protein